MAMIQVALEQDDWNRVLACLSEIPWKVSNPLIMAIGEQVRYQVAAGASASPRPNGPDEGLGLNQAKPQ